MGIRLLALLSAILIKLACPMPAAGTGVVESACGVIESWLDKSWQGSESVDSLAAAPAMPLLVLSGPTDAAHGILDVRACCFWTQNVAIRKDGEPIIREMERSDQTDFVRALMPEPGLGPLVIAALAMLALGGQRAFRWR